MKRVRHEVPGVVAVREGVSEGDIPRMGPRVPVIYHLVLLCKSCRGDSITCPSILPFFCLSPQFETQSDTHVNVQYAMTVSTSAVKDSPQPT